MVFFPPIPLIRQKMIIKLLARAKAFSSDSAKSLDEIGLVNPYGFPMITKRMVKQNIINRTCDGKYYLVK